MDNVKITYTRSYITENWQTKGGRIKLNACTTQQSNFSCVSIGVMGWRAEEIMALTNCGYICYNNPDPKKKKKTRS